MKEPEFIETGMSRRYSGPEWKLVHIHSKIVQKISWWRPISRQKEVVAILTELVNEYGSDNCLVTSAYRKLASRKYEVVFEVWQHQIEE